MTRPNKEALVDEPHCEECSILAPGDAVDWQEERAVDGTVILYCPVCWAREFGPDAVVRSRPSSERSAAR